MAEYQLTANDNAVIKKAAPPDAPYDLYVPNDPGNKDWQDYEKFLAAGGVPDPYVPPDSVLFDPAFDKGKTMHEILTG